MGALRLVPRCGPLLPRDPAGNLDGNGTAIGAVSTPNIPLLPGIPFSIAHVTVDTGAPFGIFQISGPWKVTMTR